MKSVTMNFQEDEIAALDAFADKEGLSRNGAVTHLLASALGGIPVPQVPVGNVRAAFAKELLKQAQKYVGVRPVAVQDDEVVKLEDPEADRGLEEFYANKGSNVGGGQILKKKDPLDQSSEYGDSYVQDPPQDDGDQRRKGR